MADLRIAWRARQGKRQGEFSPGISGWTAAAPEFAARLVARGAIVFALGFGALAARAGLCPDGMIFYLAGLRTRYGQLAYVDYFLPHGPVAGWVLAPFFFLPTTGGTALILASALLNAAATGLAVAIVGRVAGATAAGVAGWLTAVWFLPVFGTYYNDHLAYAGVLLGYALWQRGRAAPSGVAFALAVQTKQPIGVLSTLALMLVEGAWPWGGARGRRFALGFLGVNLLVVLYLLVLPGAAATYWDAVVRSAGEYCARATEKRWWRPLSFLVEPWHIDPIRMLREGGAGRILFYPFVLAAYVAYGRLAWARLCGPWAPADRALAFLVGSTLWSAATLGRFHGQLVFGMGAAVALLLARAKVSDGVRLGVVAVLGTVGIAFTSASHPYLFAWRPEIGAEVGDLRPLQIEWAASWSAPVAGAPVAAFGPRAVFPLLAARQVPVNREQYFQFGLSVPEAPVRRLAWQRQWLAALARAPGAYVLVDRQWAVIRAFPQVLERLRENYDSTELPNGFAWLQRKVRASSSTQPGPP